MNRAESHLTICWLPAEDSWKEAVLSWVEQVDAAFRHSSGGAERAVHPANSPNGSPPAAAAPTGDSRG